MIEMLMSEQLNHYVNELVSTYWSHTLPDTQSTSYIVMHTFEGIKRKRVLGAIE